MVSFELPHHIASAYFCILVFCFVLFFFCRWNNWNCSKTLYIPFGDSRARIKKWKTRWFIDRKGNGVGLGLVTALRFTRTLSNGPEIQNEKWLWTDYSRLDIKHLLRWDLSPLPAHGAEARCWRQFRFVKPCMLPVHVSQEPFHSYGVRRRTLSTVWEIMYFTKTKRNYFRFAPPPTPESPRQDRFKVLPTPRPKWLDLFLWLPGG